MSTALWDLLCAFKATQKVPTKVTFHRHLPAPATVRARPQAILTALSPHLPAEGAAESGFSSSPSGTRSHAGPSSGHSHRHISAPPPRRCRRKRLFIVTFRYPQLCGPVRRPFSQAYLRTPSEKVPTKVTFHRHLPVISDVARDVVQCWMAWAVIRFVVAPQIHTYVLSTKVQFR